MTRARDVVRPAARGRRTAARATPREGFPWLGLFAAAALIVVSGLTVVVRGQVVADRYACAEASAAADRWDRHLRVLDARLTAVVAELVGELDAQQTAEFAAPLPETL